MAATLTRTYDAGRKRYLEARTWAVLARRCRFCCFIHLANEMSRLSLLSFSEGASFWDIRSPSVRRLPLTRVYCPAKDTVPGFYYVPKLSLPATTRLCLAGWFRFETMTNVFNRKPSHTRVSYEPFTNHWVAAFHMSESKYRHDMDAGPNALRRCGAVKAQFLNSASICRLPRIT
jgi:hypothetical protein